jgi:hypothetical protein
MRVGVGFASGRSCVLVGGVDTRQSIPRRPGYLPGRSGASSHGKLCRSGRRGPYTYGTGPRRRWPGCGRDDGRGFIGVATAEASGIESRVHRRQHRANRHRVPRREHRREDAAANRRTEIQKPNICAFRERCGAGTKMLFECDGVPGKIEIGNGQKEGEYSLTFSVQSDLPQTHFRLLI